MRRCLAVGRLAVCFGAVRNRTARLGRAVGRRIAAGNDACRTIGAVNVASSRRFVDEGTARSPSVRSPSVYCGRHSAGRFGMRIELSMHGELGESPPRMNWQTANWRRTRNGSFPRDPSRGRKGSAVAARRNYASTVGIGRSAWRARRKPRTVWPTVACDTATRGRSRPAGPFIAGRDDRAINLTSAQSSCVAPNFHRRAKNFAAIQPLRISRCVYPIIIPRFHKIHRLIMKILRNLHFTPLGGV